MPRVSQEHLDARREQIIEAARRCFVRNGFHATSMQDILREAELSAGAAYRYFDSKEQIIVANARQMIGWLAEAFEQTLGEPDPAPLDQAFLHIGQTYERLDAEYDLGPLAVQVWGEAVRNPELRAQIVGLVRELRGRLGELVVIYQRRGELGAGDPSVVARTLLSLWPGFILQAVMLSDVDAQMFTEGLRGVLGQGKVTDE